ncbi:MAG: hypothetical protein ABFD57_00750 [Smithella sp.]
MRSAEQFAAEFLFPSEYDENIRNMNSHNDIIKFAKKLEIAHGIVAGRYQYLIKKWN